jgi:hypothetical protein
LAGADRSATSVAIAEALIANFGFDRTTFNLASGTNEGIDALSGASLSGRENRPLLITNTADSAPPVVAFATRNAANLTAIGHIFGGPAVVSTALQAAITRPAAAAVPPPARVRSPWSRTPSSRAGHSAATSVA